jgi:small-conductance mechanosensitive channel
MKQKPIFLNKIVLSLIVTIIFLAFSVTFLPQIIKDYAIKGILSLFVALVLVIFSLYISRYFDKLNLPYSKNFSNLIYVLSFLIAGLIVLKIWNVDTTIILQSSVLLGLILGLALQPILSNLFAGIIILSTRYVEVGKKIRIISSQIPYGLTALPAYKFFSVESSDLGYKGVVKKVTLFYSVFETERGDEIRIPNSILLQSVVLDAEKENVTFSMRVEFPLKMKISLEELEEKIKKTLKGFKIVEGPYFNEQSDKEYVFITLKIEAKENWKQTKSEALKKLLILKEKLERVKAKF